MLKQPMSEQRFWQEVYTNSVLNGDKDPERKADDAVINYRFRVSALNAQSLKADR